MKRLLLFLLLPGLVLAQTDTKVGSLLTVKTTEVPQSEHPEKMIKRVSLSKDRETVYQDSLHFAKKLYKEGVFKVEMSSTPLRWKDTDGTYKDYDLTIKEAITAKYQKRVEFGPSMVELDSLLNLRYEKRGTWFEAKPLFKGIRATFEPSIYQVKATYWLTEEKQSSLSWRIVDPFGIAQKKIKPFTAVDANGDSVTLVTTWTDTSLTVAIKDITGIVWPVELDPTVIDSTTQGVASTDQATALYVYGSWTKRHKSPGTGEGGYDQAMTGTVAGSYYTWRAFYKLYFDSLLVVGNVDSAKIRINKGGLQGSSGTPLLTPVLGTFTGPRDLGWFNDFYGWTADTLVNYSVVRLGPDSMLVNTNYNVPSVGKDSLRVFMNRNDTIPFVVLDTRDIYAASPSTSGETAFTTILLSVYFSAPIAPKATVAKDSILWAIRLIGVVDSTGGWPEMTAYHKYWLKGTDDTVTLTKTGTFALAESVSQFIALKDLLEGSTYLWKFGLKNYAGESWSASDSFVVSFPDTGGSTTPFYIDGRQVNIAR